MSFSKYNINRMNLSQCNNDGVRNDNEGGCDWNNDTQQNSDNH